MRTEKESKIQRVCDAGVAELADARDLKSRDAKASYRFDPGHRHHRTDRKIPYRGVEQLVARRAHNPEVVRFKSHPRNHIVKPKKISWLRTPEISRFRGFFSRFLAFSQPWGLRIQSAEKKISFQKNGFGQDLNPVVPVFKGRKCDDFTHLLPFFRIFIC